MKLDDFDVEFKIGIYEYLVNISAELFIDNGTYVGNEYSIIQCYQSSRNDYMWHIIQFNPEFDAFIDEALEKEAEEFVLDCPAEEQNILNRSE